MILLGIGEDCPAFHFDLTAWTRGESLGATRLEGRIDMKDGTRFISRNLAGAQFLDVSLSGAHFDNINLVGARFDNINFANAEITADCNFDNMRIAGVRVEDLFAAYRRTKTSDLS